MGKGLGEIFDQPAHLGQPWILHRAGGVAQSRVTRLNDGYRMGMGNSPLSPIDDLRLPDFTWL